MNKDKMEDFLEELSALTRKHKIAISALGDGPFLFHPFYAGRDDSYRCDRNGNAMIWTGDTVKPRDELKPIRKKKDKKPPRVVGLSAEQQEELPFALNALAENRGLV